MGTTKTTLYDGITKTTFYDTITDYVVLQIDSTVERYDIIKGMLFGVKTEKSRSLKKLLLSGWITQEEYDEKMKEIYDSDGRLRVVLDPDYSLMPLRNVKEDDIKEYLERNIELLKAFKTKDEIALMEEKKGDLEKYLIDNFSHLRFYTEMLSCRKGSAALIEGSIVIANTEHCCFDSNPPTFLYLQFGLTEYTVPCEEDLDRRLMRLQIQEGTQARRLLEDEIYSLFYS